jgi:hypothetical protein
MTPICLFCKHFYFSAGWAGYSEYTPGGDADMGCNKHLVDFDMWGDTTETYRQKMLTAVNCPQFDPAQEYLDYLARGQS